MAQFSLPPRYRVLLVMAVLSISIVQAILLLGQFFRIQVIEHEKWVNRAAQQHYITILDPYKRGSFYSNLDPVPSIKGSGPVSFVLDLPLYHLYSDPKSIPAQYRVEIMKEVMKRTSPNPYTTKKMWIEINRSKSRSRKLLSWISEPEKQQIAAWWYPYAKRHKIPSNALFFVADYRRMHPMGRVLGQVLHTIQERRDEKTGKAFPTGGLELSLNSYLEGSHGKRHLMRSPRNTLETGEVLFSPVDGADVELTVNHCLQAILEEEIERGVVQAQAKSGWAALVEPQTGYILALAQYPFFYPDKYKDYFNDKDRIEHTKCRAITDANEPGSPMKAITVALALKVNELRKAKNLPPIFSPMEKIAVSSGAFPGRTKPITDVVRLDWANMYMGIQKSSNIYVATIAGRMVQAMGDEWYRNELLNFGFGQKTGVELLGESVGVLPRPGKIVGKGRLEWSKATPYSLAMGYNLQATTLQMARVYCALANNGVLPELTLIKKIVRKHRDGSSEILIDNTREERKERFRRILSPEVVQEVIRAMKFVTKPGGSAYKADILGYTEAGKTGTTMKLKGGSYTSTAHFSSFVGFAPLSSPKFVLAIGLDEPKVGYIPGRGLNHRGGTSATPIFREIGRRVLEVMGVPPDDPYGYPKGDPRSNLEKADWYKESESLRTLLNKWNKRGGPSEKQMKVND